MTDIKQRPEEHCSRLLCSCNLVTFYPGVWTPGMDWTCEHCGKVHSYPDEQKVVKETKFDEQIDELEDLLKQAINKAIQIQKIAGDGLVKNQLEYYTIGTLKSFITNEYQPGSIKSLKKIIEDKEK